MPIIADFKNVTKIEAVTVNKRWKHSFNRIIMNDGTFFYCTEITFSPDYTITFDRVDILDWI